MKFITALLTFFVGLSNVWATENMLINNPENVAYCNQLYAEFNRSRPIYEVALLRSLQLNGADLKNAYLSENINMRHAKMRGADISGLRGFDKDFSHADFYAVRFSENTDLRGSEFTCAKVSEDFALH